MRYVFALLVLFAAAGCSDEVPPTPASLRKDVSHFPKVIDKTCRDGDAVLYDECGSQATLFRDALAEANGAGKTLIVSVGAEWCIWCHVFSSHLLGVTGEVEHRAFDQKIRMVEYGNDSALLDAKRLNEFASAHLVLVHLEFDHAPDAGEVLVSAGVDPAKITSVPYIFSVTPEGRVAAAFSHEKSEVRSDPPFSIYRGYDRKSLLAQMQQLREAARAKPKVP